MTKNKTNGSLDTNLLLRLLLGDVPKQAAIVEDLVERATQLDVADVAIIELVFVLEKVYGLKRPMVVTNVRSILNSPKINCNRELFAEVIVLYESEPKLSIVDCSLLVYARLNKATPLYTFDKALVKKSEGDCVLP